MVIQLSEKVEKWKVEVVDRVCHSSWISTQFDTLLPTTTLQKGVVDLEI